MRVIRSVFAAVLLFAVTSNLTAQPTVEAKLIITPHEAVVEPGQGLKFQAQLFNSKNTPIRIDKLIWGVAPESLGKISEDGFFIAGREEGEGTIFAKAQVGEATYAAEARVTIGGGAVLPVRIAVEPGEAVVPPLGTQQFKALIVTSNRQSEPATHLKWEVVPNTLGTIEPNTGLFTAGQGTGAGAVVAFVEIGGAIYRGEARVIVAAATAGLAGNVTDQKTGNPIENAVVWADYVGPFRLARRVQTDAQGNYVFEKLFAGVYVVRAEAPSYLPEFYKDAERLEQATPVRLAENENIEGIDFTLGRGAQISGLVATNDDNKTPIAGAHVAAILALRPDLKYHTVTDEQGKYALTALPAGTYVIFAEAGGYRGEFFDDARDRLNAKPISVENEQTVDGIDFLLAAASAISGRVVDAVSNEPIAKAHVTIYALINSADRPRPLFNVLTNEHGEYIATVPPGSYIVSAEARGYHKEIFEEARDFSNAKPVQVLADQHTVDVNFTMDKLASITGKVTDAVSGVPIAGAIVNAFQENAIVDPAINKDELRFPYVAKTDENGNYTLEGLRTGQYFVMAHASGYLPEFWQEAATLQEAKPVEVPESGNVDNIDFTLGQGGAISGAVISAANQEPIAGALVQVFKAASNAPLGRAVTGEDGKYRIAGLLSGEYIVFASARGFNGLYYENVERRENATPVKVEAPQETGDINFQMKPFDRPGGAIAGVVVSAVDEIPIPHAFVLAIPVSAANNVPTPPLFAMADEFGNYQINGAPAGKYVAVAAAPHFISEFFENARSFREATVFTVENSVVDNINFSLAPARRGPYQIIGRVRHQMQDGGVENVLVQALEDNIIVATALAGADGGFILEDMPAGEFKITATSPDGDAEQQVPVSISNGLNATNVELVLGTTSVKETTATVPIKFDLEQNFPNPFWSAAASRLAGNPETSIKYHLPVRSNVTLRIYNALGQEVRTLVSQVQDAGVYSARWDGKDNKGRQLAAGLYLFRLEAGDFVMTRKMAMVK